MSEYVKEDSSKTFWDLVKATLTLLFNGERRRRPLEDVRIRGPLLTIHVKACAFVLLKPHLSLPPPNVIALSLFIAVISYDFYDPN